MSEQPNCCLCGQPCEPWWAADPATGYGHNPAPLGITEDDRCCDDCNATKVIPARIQPIANRLNAKFNRENN